jgi:ATP phosphoribosyltransferase regulatory subunit
LDLGHVGVVSALAEHVGLTKDQHSDYVDMLARKSIPEINEWLETQSFSLADSEMLRELPLLCGGSDIINKAQQVLKKAGTAVSDALQHLQKVSILIKESFPNLQLHIDLAEMRGYAYHTGIMYTAYLLGRGESIAQGGRYDGIGEAFGNNRPAIGFSTDLRTLAELSTNHAINKSNILAPAVTDKILGAFIHDLRSKGETVIRQLDDRATPQQYGCNRIIEKQGDDWVLASI